MRSSRVPLGAIFAVSLLLLGATPLLSAMTAGKTDAVPGGSAPGRFDPWADLDPAHSRLVDLTLRNVAWSPDQRLALAQVAASLPADVVRDLLDANESAYLADLPMGAAHRIAAVLPEFASAGIHPLNCIINCAVTAGLLRVRGWDRLRRTRRSRRGQGLAASWSDWRPVSGSTSGPR